MSEMVVDAPAQVVGRVKWFDTDRGFGFLESEGGDVMVHFSVLKPHGHRSVPEGAMLEVEVINQPGKGLYAKEVRSIDLSGAKRPRHSKPRKAEHGEPGDWELVEVKWFNPVRGYGFVMREDCNDVFVHAAAIRKAGFDDLSPGEWIEARIADSPKGKVAAEVRRVG